MSLEDLVNEEPFDYLATKNGLVQISYNGQVVTTLSGRDGVRFINKVEAGDRKNAQLVMAKATGHFKHGTEKSSKFTRS